MRFVFKSDLFDESVHKTGLKDRTELIETQGHPQPQPKSGAMTRISD